MANAPNSTSDRAGSFTWMYFILLVGLIVLALGLFLYFATRQPHGKVSGAGTQKGMITTRGSTTG